MFRSLALEIWQEIQLSCSVKDKEFFAADHFLKSMPTGCQPDTSDFCFVLFGKALNFPIASLFPEVETIARKLSKKPENLCE